METLSGHRGSEALNSGACRKLILFLPFLPPIPALPPGCHLGRCRRNSLYSSVNEVLMNLEGQGWENINTCMSFRKWEFHTGYKY